METSVKMNTILRLLLLGSLIVFFTVGITPSALANCAIPKNLNPIQKVTETSNRITALVKKIDSVKSAEKIIPSIIECAKKLDAHKNEMDSWLNGLKRDKKTVIDVAKQLSIFKSSASIMLKEMMLVEKRVPAFKMKNQLMLNIKKPQNKKPIKQKTSKIKTQQEYIPTSEQKHAMQEAKKLLHVTSHYLFQPIKDYSDSAPIPTSLPYASNALMVCQSDIEAWQAERKKTGFVDTLWKLQFSPKHYRMQPGENKKEYLRYIKALTMWNNMAVNLATGAVRGDSSRTHIVHLRKDGVFGLSWSPTYKVEETGGKAYLNIGKEKPRLYYDPANRWGHKKGNRIELYWQNSKQAYPIYSATAKYESYHGSIISSYYLLSTVVKAIPGWFEPKSRAYAKLEKTVNAELVKRSEIKKTSICHNSKASSPAVSQKQKTQNTKSLKLKTTKQNLPKTKPVASKPDIIKKIQAPTLVGCWNWVNGGYIVVEANGKARNGAIEASWKTVDKAKNRYTIIWPPIVDTLTLSKSGRELNGSNSFGLSVSAKRKTGAGQNLLGRWLWNNGMTVDIHPDNSVSVGIFHGKVRKAGKQWKINWPVDDEIRLASNGNSLNLKNQFGALTATRDKSCKKR